MAHLSDLSWEKSGEEALKDYAKGDTVEAKILEVDIEKAGLDVTFGEENETKAFIRKGDLSRERSEQRPERFAVGDKVDAKITRANRARNDYQLSIKALEIAEEKEAVEQYGSADSGASLGDILGAALKGDN